MKPRGSKRPDDRRVEPLLSALEDEEKKEVDAPPSRDTGLGWKLLWAALVLIGLLALVLNQAF